MLNIFKKRKPIPEQGQRLFYAGWWIYLYSTPQGTHVFKTEWNGRMTSVDARGVKRMNFDMMFDFERAVPKRKKEGGNQMKPLTLLFGAFFAAQICRIDTNSIKIFFLCLVSAVVAVAFSLAGSKKRKQDKEDNNA